MVAPHIPNALPLIMPGVAGVFSESAFERSPDTPQPLDAVTEIVPPVKEAPKLSVTFVVP
jgi:hypothetical protein